MSRNAILILSILAVFGCTQKTSPFEMAQEEIFSFHENYNLGDIETVYWDSSVVFRNTVDAATLKGNLQLLHVDLGNHLNSEVVDTNTTYGCTGTTVRVSLQSEFERGQILEEFVYVAEKGKYRLSYYYHGPYGEATTPTNLET